MRMPKQKPGRSKQDYETPPEFIEAVESRFGKIDFDLAASLSNTKAPRFFSTELKQTNALASDNDWRELNRVRVAWLNPPFSLIPKFIERAERCRDLKRWTLVLVPGSIGTVWWKKHVLNKAYIDGIPRLTFVGEPDPYPKDLALLAYGYGISGFGYWDYRLNQ